MKLDVLAWDHRIGFTAQHRWFAWEKRCLEGRNVDLEMVWPSAGQSPREDADILYIPLQCPTITHLELFGDHPAKRVIRYHDFLSDDGKDAERLQAADLILADTEHVCRQVRNRVTGAKVAISPLGVDPKLWERPTYLNRPVGRQDGLCVLWVGTEKASKNLETVMTAMRLVEQPGDELVIISDGRDRPHYKKIEAGLELKSARWITRCAERTLRRWYWQASVLAQVEREAGFGMPIVEAFACKLPVIAGKGGANEEVAGEAAIATADTTDADDLAEAFTRVRTMPAHERASYGEKGYKRMDKHFNDVAPGWLRAVRSHVDC